jgi:hypothetical protein
VYITNWRCIKLADVVGGRPDFIMADCSVGAQAPGRRGVCRPSSARATKVHWLHSPGESTGVGEGPCATHSQFCSILAELACVLACHTVSE